MTNSAANPLQEKNIAADSKPLSRATVLFMAVSVGLIVANIYYVQPLLSALSNSFHISVAAAGGVAMATQLGSAFGMLLLVPLGDTMERRKLISRLIGVEVVCLTLAAISPGVLTFASASIGIGFACAAVHVFLPFAAHLAKPSERGKVVGTVLSGLLLGILLARTISGSLGAVFGWRSVYFVGAGLMAVLLGFVQFLLPKDQPELVIAYRDLMSSVIGLIKKHQPLRESALLGACLFCVFSAFWTTLIFLLQSPPYHYGSEVAGAFGLVGAAGAIGAIFVGRLADRYPPRDLVAVAVALVFLSYLILAFGGKNMVGLVIGVILLDFGVQAGHVSNQSRIYALDHTARSRLNTFYMVSYFTGGSLGSLFAGLSWQAGQWTGVCAFALAILTFALAYLARLWLLSRRTHPLGAG